MIRTAKLHQKAILPIPSQIGFLANKYAQLKSNHNPILDGYGEFILYQKSGSRHLSENLYDLAFSVLEQERIQWNHPSNRTHRLREKLHSIDTNLEIAFIPRTLYELLYIREAIQEEIKDREICPLQYPRSSRIGNSLIIPGASSEKARNCWHLCEFGDQVAVGINIDGHGTVQELPSEGKQLHVDDQCKKMMMQLAYRLNEVAVQRLKIDQALTGAEITAFTEREITYLQEHRQTFPAFFHEMKSGCGCSGGAINFGLAHGNGERVRCDPTGIRNNKDAQIVQHAVALECDESAQNSFILYRGGNLDPLNKIASVSWGTSLFSSAFVDGTACPFHYMTYQKKNLTR